MRFLKFRLLIVVLFLLPFLNVFRTILSRTPLILSVETRACSGKANEINFLEHVILRISLTHSRRGDLQIFLTSPAGTRSNILESRYLHYNDFQPYLLLSLLETVIITSVNPLPPSSPLLPKNIIY